ncbi:MAG: hypothetical protein RLY86_458 [Pseudomonadota bacterium]|jgi:hypothetical protein
MILTWMNFFSFCALALTGAVLVVSARRVHKVIKATERKIAVTVDEKNALAADLRMARRDETLLKQAITEAEEAITSMTKLNDSAEARIEALKLSDKVVMVMVDQDWRRFDRLWQVPIMNPSMPSAVHSLPGGQPGADGRMVHGFARSGHEFRLRVEERYPPRAGFIVGEAEMVDLEKSVVRVEAGERA